MEVNCIIIQLHLLLIFSNIVFRKLSSSTSKYSAIVEREYSVALIREHLCLLQLIVGKISLYVRELTYRREMTSP